MKAELAPLFFNGKVVHNFNNWSYREAVGWNIQHGCQVFFLLEPSLNFSIPFFPAFCDKQIISYWCSQKLGCDTLLSAAPVDYLLEICLVSKTLICGRTNCKIFFWKEMLPLLFWTCPYWRFGNTVVKIFDLNPHSKLNSGMEFCAYGTAHSVHCLCVTQWSYIGLVLVCCCLLHVWKC